MSQKGIQVELNEKIAIVTGASRGIGRAIAESLAQYGATVVCCSTKEETSKVVADEIKDQYNVETGYYGCDVSNKDDIDALIGDVVKKYGKIDILVNNAGITKDNLLLRMSKDDWDSVLDINLNSVFYSTKSVLRPMLKQKFGRIINVTSVVGVMGNPGQGNYAASKAGVIGFTKSIAKEVAHKGITCNAIAPGFIETDMISSLPKEYLDNIIGMIPQKKLGRPQDVGALAAFFASDMSTYITGQVVNIDGGILM